MPHIHTEKGQHDHTVTAYIVRTDGPEPCVLMHMHRKLNKLMPIGGHVELDESPWQAIAHELREESGYDLDALLVLQPKDRIRTLAGTTLHPYPVLMDTHDFFRDNPGQHYHSNTSYAFVAASGPLNPVQEGESQDLRWLTRRELDAAAADSLFENNRQAYRFILDRCLTDWEAVAPSVFS